MTNNQGVQPKAASVEARLPDVSILVGDCRARLRDLEAGSAHTCVTSPPYFGLRDYGHAGQIGLEATPDQFVAELVEVFREVRRVLRDDGTLWLNLGDSYARGFGGGSPGAKSATNVGSFTDRKPGKVPPGFHQKDRLMIPARVAIALQSDGWILRDEIVWHKTNAMTQSVLDRTTSSHEMVYLFSKSSKYYYNSEAVKEITADGAGMRNRRSVWSVPTQPLKEAHFATYPPALIEPCILAGAPRGGMVLDPFGGSGTTGIVAFRNQRSATLIELNPEYAEMSRRRIAEDQGIFGSVEIAA